MRAKFSARTGSRMARDPRDGGSCAAPDFMRQVWGDMALFVEAPTLYWPVVLNLCGLQ